MLKAIETKYKGYRFRSRLEARWAVFFDALGLKWEYETEGFELPSGRYLPDFFLPDLNGGMFVEVKPDDSSWDDYIPKFKELATGSGKPILFAGGTPANRIYTMAAPPDGYCNEVRLHDVCFNAKYLPPRPHDTRPRLFWYPGSEEEADCYEAVEAARSARFEFEGRK